MHPCFSYTLTKNQLLSLDLINSTAFIFKLSHFYIFSDLITYCIILSRTITCVSNPYFLTLIDKPWFVYHSYCHMISHGDDRNKINTILPLEWTGESRQRVTAKKECRSQRGYQQMLVLSNLRSPDTREKEGEAKWLAGTLKRKWHLLLRRRKKREEKPVIGKGSWQTDP